MYSYCHANKSYYTEIWTEITAAPACLNLCSFVKNDSLINGCVCKLHKASVGSELPNTFLLCKHRRYKTSLSWPELKVSRGRRDRATDRLNFLWHTLREREKVLELIIPLHVCRKIAEDLEMKGTSLSICWISKHRMSNETGYKTRYLCVGERGKEGVFFLCLCLSFWKGQRTLAASELPQESNSTELLLFWTQQTSNLPQEHSAV